MSQRVSVNDYMATDVVTVTPDMDIHRAIRLLLEKKISGVPVVDDRGGLVGLLTTKDCLNIAFSTSYHNEWGGSVSDFMSRDVQTVTADTDVVEVAERFLKFKFHRYPVIRNQRLVGIISRHDVLRALDKLW